MRIVPVLVCDENSTRSGGLFVVNPQLHVYAGLARFRLENLAEFIIADAAGVGDDIGLGQMPLSKAERVEARPAGGIFNVLVFLNHILRPKQRKRRKAIAT